MAGIQNKLLTGTIIVIHSEKEVFVVYREYWKYEGKY